MKVPKRLKKGDTVGLIAPSSSTKPLAVEKSIKALEEFGFKVKVGRSCYESYGYLSGSDEIRSSDINTMFADKDIDGIFCIRGGYGTIRILDRLDYDVIRNNPKVFVGYSDITTLHIMFNQLCGFVTYHGPMPSIDMIDTFKDFSKASLIQNIIEENNVLDILNPSEDLLETYRGGVAQGVLVGGNLSLIASTIGTPYEIDTEGKILFIEDIDEEPYSVDRMLSQLRLSGKLDDCEGIIIGDFNNCIPKAEKSLTLDNAIDDILEYIDKPMVKGLKAGHCKPMITLALGREIILDADKLIIKYV